MNFSEEWEAFTQTLVARAVDNYRNSEEYTYYRHRAKDIDELLSNTLCEDEKELVDKTLFELGAAQIGKRKWFIDRDFTMVSLS